MLKLTKTGIGLLTNQYRSVLKKCLLLNLGLFFIFPIKLVLGNTLDDIGISGTPYIRNDGVFLNVVDSSYRYTATTGGNFIKSYYDGLTGYQYNRGGDTYQLATTSIWTRIFSWVDEFPLAYRILDDYYWTFSNGKWYNSYITSNPGLSTADKNELISQFRNMGYNLVNPTAKGDVNFTRNTVTLADNIAILDEVIGTWGDATYIKKFDSLEYRGTDASTGYKSSTIGANLKALDTAIGSWNGGHYIKNSVSSSTPADTTHLTVGQALSALDEQLYNYYYTFRVDERVEAIEFAKELRSNKKEMSSLDFMPIKSSSDLRINLIKAEDPLTFSAKTRDDSLDLREVCHA